MFVYGTKYTGVFILFFKQVCIHKCSAALFYFSNHILIKGKTRIDLVYFVLLPLCESARVQFFEEYEFVFHFMLLYFSSINIMAKIDIDQDINYAENEIA